MMSRYVECRDLLLSQWLALELIWFGVFWNTFEQKVGKHEPQEHEGQSSDPEPRQQPDVQHTSAVPVLLWWEVGGGDSRPQKLSGQVVCFT